MAKIFSLDFPQSLGVFDEYLQAQKAVDHLADHDFPVQNLLIVGTDLKQIERVTGRLTWGRVLANSALAGASVGLFAGILLSLFVEPGQWWQPIVSAVVFGVVWGLMFGSLRYAFSGGQRDFSSVQAVLPSKYEVLVEHKYLAQGQTELIKAGLLPDPLT